MHCCSFRKEAVVRSEGDRLSLGGTVVLYHTFRLNRRCGLRPYSGQRTRTCAGLSVQKNRYSRVFPKVNFL